MTFRVEWSGNVSADLKDLQRRTAALHQGDDHGISVAMKEIDRRLIAGADEWGEPLYRLGSMKAQVRTAMVTPIVVHYGVHEESRNVFVQSFRYCGVGLKATKSDLEQIEERSKAGQPTRLSQRFGAAMVPVGESKDFYRGLVGVLRLLEMTQGQPTRFDPDSIRAILQRAIDLLKSV